MKLKAKRISRKNNTRKFNTRLIVYILGKKVIVIN